MTQVTQQGRPVAISGAFPQQGASAPDFCLAAGDLSDKTLADFAGKRKILNIFPSVDTPVCASSVRKFNEAAQQLPNTVVLCVSVDLPFAHSRFCGAEGLESVVSVSELSKRQFGEDYGVRIVDGPIAGLFSRAVVILDEKGVVRYTEQVPEIAQEPNYEAALKALR